MPMRNRIGGKDASANHKSGRMAPLPFFKIFQNLPNNGKHTLLSNVFVQKITYNL